VPPRAWIALLALLPLAGCGGDRAKPSATAKAPAAGRDRAPSGKVRWPRRVPCPPAAGNCSSARGTVIYVEAVDPDGDGDAHFVLTSSESVTAPGLTVIDCEKPLRPRPLPRIGDRIAAAGPVYRGSHGQRQIQATTIRVARDR
jgi:hypothetical protein